MDQPFLESGEVLLHIGPPKTGTTALQYSLAQARKQLRRQGVLYPGRKYSHWRASCAALGTSITAHPADEVVERRYWDQLTARVARRRDRAVVSSELFTDADDDVARAVVADLGADMVRVLLTVRPVALILPSSWQQSLKSGAPTPLPGPLRRVKSRVVKKYDQWLDGVLKDRNDLFWDRFDYGRLVSRWADIVGPDRICLVVVDSGDPLRLLRDAERVIGIEADTLRRVSSKTNRSLSVEEAALVREWLVRVERDLPMPAATYHQWIRRGALWGLVDGRQPGPNEHALRTPEWAVDLIDARVDEMAQRIESLGVRVVGDLADLHVPATPSADPDEVATVPIDIAMDLLQGLATMAAKDVSAASRGT